MQVIIDTSFILHCIRKGINLVEQLESKGFKIAVPREVLQELRNLHHNVKTARDEKKEIIKVLNILDDHRRFKRISAGQGRLSDWLMKKDNEGYFIATADSSIKHKIKNRVMIN